MLWDPSVAAQWVLSLFLLVAGAAMLVRRAASNYFASSFANLATIGAAATDMMQPAVCAVCGVAASKKCSRCKSVRYCSQACQSKHWLVHKLKCKQIGLSDAVNVVSCENSIQRRNISSAFSSVALVPPRGTCWVLQDPKKILFPYDEFVNLFHWDKPGFPPCGLLNCGNSCYANVVLQCLASTRPLIAYMLELDHNRECVTKQEGLCFLCELQTYIRRASQSSCTFSPAAAISSIDPDLLKDAKQEDAHEFMRLAIEKMQSICLDEYGGEKLVAPSSQETTFIQYTFGGHLLSQVTCTQCNMVSDRYESMMDLTVEIQGEVESLEECLNQFTAREWLDGDNKYKCDGCNEYVKARKRLTIHQAPNILTIALKRFQKGRFGKLNKRVAFSEILNLSPYMSGSAEGTDLYSLYAVVVHLDVFNASYYGHYICYAKDHKGQWYKIDDCKVMNVEVEEVLGQGAYMLLYSRINARKCPFFKPLESGSKQQSFEADSVPSSIPAAADDCKVVTVKERDLDSINTGITQANDVMKETNSGSMEDLPFRINSPLLSEEFFDVHKEENSELKKVPQVQSSLSCKDALDSGVPEKVSVGTPSQATSSDFNMQQCNGSLCHSSRCHSDESSGCSETINLNKSQESSLDLKTTCKTSSDLAGGAFGVNGSAPIGRIANGHQRKSKPFLSPGFLNVPARKKPSACTKAMVTSNSKDLAVLLPIVQGYSNGHLNLNSDQDMATSSSLFTKDGLSSPKVGDKSSFWDEDKLLLGKSGGVVHPDSKTTSSAFCHQNGCMDDDDRSETSCLAGGKPMAKKSNAINEDANGVHTRTHGEEDVYCNSSYGCTGELRSMSKLNKPGIMNGQMNEFVSSAGSSCDGDE